MKRTAAQAAGLLIGLAAPALASGLGPNLSLLLLAPQAGASSSAPMVEISKSCPNMRYLGRDATFEITVTNRGGGVAQNVVVTDQIVGSELLKVDNGGAREGGNVVWRLGTLEPGATKTLSATVRCNTIGTVHNTATVTYCAEASAGCEFEVKGIPAILLECVDDPDPIEVGGNVTYTITVTNQGTAVGTNIEIVCELPPEEEFVSAKGPVEGSAEGRKVAFKPLPSLSPKAVATYKVVVKGTAVGDVRFGVQLTSDQVKAPPVMETESTHIY